MKHSNESSWIRGAGAAWDRRGSGCVADGAQGGGRGEQGFTLVELLVVVAVIGILAGISLTVYSRHHAEAYDAHSLVGLNTLAKAEEAYFASNGRYTPDVAELRPYNPPSGVLLAVLSADHDTFVARASHPRGKRTYRWDSSAGGLQP